MQIIIAYMPVLHQGYYKFLEQNQDAETLYIWGPEIIALFDHLQRKDIRALEPEIIKQSLKNWGFKFDIKILDLKILKNLNNKKFEIILPNETESQELSQKYLKQANLKFKNIFLRYHKQNALKKHKVNPNNKISKQKFDQEKIKQAFGLAEDSWDWWRQVGAVIIKDGRVVLTGLNEHVPHQQMPYINGDPRGNFHKGEYIELSTALHAEAAMIAEAAKRGLDLENAALYITTFPCPPCAKLIAYSGIKKLYFKKGYAMLDGESILKSQGVEIVQVVD